jgi:hypothetical protein
MFLYQLPLRFRICACIWRCLALSCWYCVGVSTCCICLSDEALMRFSSVIRAVRLPAYCFWAALAYSAMRLKMAHTYALTPLAHRYLLLRHTT